MSYSDGAVVTEGDECSIVGRSCCGSEQWQRQERPRYLGQTPAVKVRIVVKPEVFVELDGGGIFAGDRQGEFAKFHGAQSFGGALHQHAADAVALIAGEDADLRGVADAGGDFAGEDGGDQIVRGTGLAKDEGGARDELSAAGQQDDVFQEFEGAGFAAVLIVDFAVDVIGVAEIDELGTGLEKAIVPAIQAHACRGVAAGGRGFVQVEEHELAGVKVGSPAREGALRRGRQRA